MPNKWQFKTHEEWRNWYREYRKKNALKFKLYNKKYNRKWRKKHGYHKDRVRSKVYRAVKSGKLLKTPCEKCQNPLVEAHHDDYRMPLKIRWLCRICHRAVDVKTGKRNS